MKELALLYGDEHEKLEKPDYCIQRFKKQTKNLIHHNWWEIYRHMPYTRSYTIHHQSVHILVGITQTTQSSIIAPPPSIIFNTAVYNTFGYDRKDTGL